MALFKSNVQKLEEKVADLEAGAAKARQSAEAILLSAEAGGPVTAEDLARERATAELAEARLRGALRDLVAARVKAEAEEREAEVRRLRAARKAAADDARAAADATARAAADLMVAWSRNVAAGGKVEAADRALGELGAIDAFGSLTVSEFDLAELAHDLIRKDPTLSARLGSFFSRELRGLGYFVEPEP